MRRKPEIPVLFPYFGQKRSLLPCYPPPSRNLIVEPFAGSAAYSRKWGAGRDVLLVEKAGWLARMWQWLVQADVGEIMSLPLLEKVPREGLEALDLREEARSLIGIKIRLGAKPSMRPTTFALQHQIKGEMDFWNPRSRRIIADNLKYMRHWRVVHGSYERAPDVEASWFVDPPYQRMPDEYTASLDDYPALGRWCRGRRGQVIVCEDIRATWLPFRRVNLEKRGVKKATLSGRSVQAGKSLRMEGIWYREN